MFILFINNLTVRNLLKDCYCIFIEINVHRNYYQRTLSNKFNLSDYTHVFRQNVLFCALYNEIKHDNYRQYLDESVKNILYVFHISDVGNVLQNYNTEDIINAVILMSADSDYMLADTNMPAAEWIASNALRYNNTTDLKFDIKAYDELKQISSNIYTPLVSEIFEDAIKHKDDSDENKQDIKRFELLKSQILSGNDSRELLREFKLLLFKL